jgi:glycosyltransferase involved in cell wall biosynthesis
MYTGDRRSMLQSILFAISCLRMLVIGRFDVIEADHMPYLQLYPLRVVAWIRRVPLVVTWHEVWGTSYWDQYLGGFAGRIAALIERTATKIPDRIVAVSSGTAEQLIKMGVPSSKISILWAGVSVDELDLVQPATNSPDIICAGRLIAHKRVDLVLEAVALLRDEGKDRTLSVTGSGPEKERLIAQSHTLGINDLVTFHGELPESEQVWSLMKGARVCAAPSEREGFGLAVAESLAAGTPVVVVDHPSNASRHLVDNEITGSVIAPGDVHQLAASIEYWMEHTHEHHSQGVRFEERHPHLSWDGLTERYAELIREVT